MLQKKFIKTSIVFLILILLLGAFAACGNTSSATPPADDENAETKDTTKQEGADAENGSGENSESEENKDSVEDVKSTTTLISSTVQEQLKNLYDKHVDKDTTAWESNWATSSALPTAQIGVSYLSALS